MAPLGFPPTLATLAAVLFAGRVVLSWLPPGQPGRHAWRELSATLAASQALGVAALALVEAGVSAFDAYPGLESRPGLVLRVVPFALAGALRVAMAPGAMTPRRWPREERPGLLARLLLVAALGAGLFAVRDARPLEGASWLGALAAVATGLRTARRSPAARRAVVLALALAPPFSALASGPQAHGALLVASTAAGAVAWVRRADGRGLWLAVLALAGLLAAQPADAGVALAGAAALVAATARASRLRAALASAGALGLPLALARAAGSAPPAPAPPATSRELVPWIALAWALLVLGGLGLARGETARRPADDLGRLLSVDPPRRELVFLAGWWAALFLLLGVAADVSRNLSAALLLAPATALFAGLLLARGERTHPAP